MELVALAVLPGVSLERPALPDAAPLTEAEAADWLKEPEPVWTHVWETTGDGRAPGTVEHNRDLGIENHWLEDGWVVHEMRGQPVKVGKANVALDPVSKGGCGWMPPNAVGVLQSPPRFVYRCSLPIDGETAYHSVLWTPEGTHSWVQRPPSPTMYDAGALAFPILPETGEIENPKSFGDLPAMVDEYRVFIDLAEAKRWTTPVGVDPIHMSIRGIPKAGLLEGVDDGVVYQVDFDAGTLLPLTDFPSCDGAMVERRRKGDRVLLHCLNQPERGMFRFDIVWGAVYDLASHELWMLEQTPEAFSDTGVVVSQRSSSAAESSTARGTLGHVVLP